MKIVKDNEGRPWQIAISAASAMRVEEAVKVTVHREVEKPDGAKVVETMTVPFAIADISKIAETLTILRSGYLSTAATLWAIVQPQAVEKGITRDQFLEALTGDSLQAMSAALVDELFEFFPPGQRPMLRTLKEKLDDVADSLIRTAEKRLEELDTKTAAQVFTAAPATT
jgi:hypothetical protein